MADNGIPTLYGVDSGTSFAAPHVAGVLALLHSEHPEWSHRELIDRVLDTVTAVELFRSRLASGGTLNAAAALAR